VARGATAFTPAANGALVAVVGRDQDAIDRSVAAITAYGGRAIGVVADCTIESDLDALRLTVEERLGPVDILAAFASANGMPVPTTDETAAHWRSVVESDLACTFLTVSAFLPSMISRDTA
jgi:3-oxoacyl-[acyl-carrier protein] reductase